MEFTLNELRALLFRDYAPKTKAASPVLGDIAKITVVSLEIGQKIKTLDDREEFFHVEITADHAEVWLTYEWSESNARRQKFRAQAAADMEVWTRNKALSQELRDAMAGKLPDSVIDAVTAEIVKSYHANDFGALIRHLRLDSIIDKYKQQ